MGFVFFVIRTNAQTPLSFEESLHLLNQGNQSLKIADKGIEIAKAERDKLKCFLVSYLAVYRCICAYVREDRSEAATVSVY